MSDQPSILPPNSTSLERSLERLIQSTRPDLSPVATLMNPDSCPADLLGWLAWAFSVDVWEPSWDEATKRRVIKAALEVHRRKGTIGAVRRALEAIGFGAEIREWFQPQGRSIGLPPRSFAVFKTIPNDTFVEPDIPAGIKAARKVIDATKPVAANYTFVFEQGAGICVRSAGALFGRQFGKRADELKAIAQATIMSAGVIAVQMRQVKPSPMPLRLAARSAGALLCIIREKEVTHAA
ncbi:MULTISPECIES: phage tail protein I [unclassified Phaeobacter]|uniref:phage tail protein I n=1 Tax=unclassified Phaeobacter TaxID=2621772 RepID=UPI003A8B8A8C